MQVHSIDAGHFKLDGGAMFGVVPKSIWNKLQTADENNMCSWNMRCLLINIGSQLILIDTGMGDKQDAKFQGFYYRHGEGNLLESIKKAGYSPTEITDVVLSHLHFDHAGGAVQWKRDKSGFELTFPNAKYWTHSEHWHLATNPNSREKPSFIKENLFPIQESGHLYFVDEHQNPFGKHIELLTSNGHTEKMLLPKIEIQGKKVVFMADTIPTTSHIPIPYVMGYDTRPLQTMLEKEILLKRALDENWILFFDHDPSIEAATVQGTEKGIRLNKTGLLKDFIA